MTAAGLLVHLTGGLVWCDSGVQNDLGPPSKLHRSAWIQAFQPGEGGFMAWLHCSAVHLLPTGSGCGSFSVHIYELAFDCFCCRPTRVAKSS